MKKSSHKSNMTLVEVFHRMTWMQRIMYLLFPVVFFGIILLNVWTVLKQSMTEMRNTGIIQATALRDAVEEYLHVADDTVDNLARNVEYMQDQGATKEEIVEYMGIQTEIVSEILAADSTGLYGYVNGEYVDSIWVPDDDYDPTTRPWYIEACAAGGDLVYVSPYLDLQTGEAIVTVAKQLSDHESVVAIDFKTNRLQTILDELSDEDSDSYCVIVDMDGTIVAHPDSSKIGMNYVDGSNALGTAIAKELGKEQQTNFRCRDGRNQYVFMIESIGGSWYTVAITEMSALVKGVISVILISAIVAIVAIIAIIVFTLRMAASRIQAEDFNQSLHSLSEIYVSMHRIDLDWNTYEEISSSLEELREVLDYRGNDARNKFRKAVGKLSANESREEMLEFIDLDTLGVRMQNTDTITTEYLSSSNQWRRARFIVSERTESGRLISVLYVVEDIDAERRLRDDLINHSEEMERAKNLAEEARRAAEEANEAKTHFLANMSHEIRTPINTVLGLDTMILREAQNENIREYAMDIQSAGQSLLSIINDILDLSKIESGKMEIVPVDYDVASMIHDVVNMITPRANNKALEFHVNIDDTIPSRLFGDDVRIRQIMLNLLTNAVKYTHQGQVVLSMHCEMIEDHKVMLYVSVQDTGIGIAQEDLDKLFQAFVRIEEKRNRNIEGTGLGINITTQLLKMMGSNLEVHSVYGQGSNFHFALEQEVTDPETIKDLEQSIRNRVTEYAHEAGYILPDVKLLVVDDNSMNRFVFKELLKDYECQIDEAEGGEQSVAMANREKYDIIFMDHMMPGVDGIEAFHRIRDAEDGMNRETPVIILTANAISGAKEQYLLEGFTDYLSKPIVPERLEKMLAELIPDEKKQKSEKKSRPADQNPVADMSKPHKNEKDSLPEVEGVDWDYALMKLQKVQLLKNVIQDLSKSAEGDIGLLRRHYQNLVAIKDEEAFQAYRIKVHAMKSSSAMVGAMNVSSLAKILEYAARDRDFATIEALMNIFDREWLMLKERLDDAFDLREEEVVAELPCDTGLLVQELEKLEEAVDGLDFDAADSIVKELKKYGYDEHGEAVLQSLEQAVFDMDVDLCMEAIEKWKALLP